MNPPLDGPPSPPENSRPPGSESFVIAPDSVHDLRGRIVDELRYPAMVALIVAGVPGAGKSTALRVFFGATADADQATNGPEGSVVLDSNQTRNWWRHRVGWLPYLLWRPVVHIAHFARIRNALRDNAGPVVIHDCATFGWTRRLLARWAAGYRREVHVILLDVPATTARAGQFARGRRINGPAFSLHCRRWRRLIRELGAGHVPRPAPASIVLIDRTNVDRISRIGFVKSESDV
ncbi:AAA family ATPase [Nocardia sp. KC 131]|uniref:AAA family ATPase n=1 Tax=Nocardia arseniciresistens TaxID=3392119 RepID=UPI00398ED89F